VRIRERTEGYDRRVAGVLTEAARTGGTGEGDDASHRRRRDLVVVAHRGPVRFVRENMGERAERNAGGLVTALRDLARAVEDPLWICAAATDEDREHAAAPWVRVPLGTGTCRVRMLALDPDAHHKFYAQIANPLLWFVQHYLWDHSRAPVMGREEHEAWRDGYVAVNEAFARAICDLDATPPQSLVMVHDYHFYLVPALVRDVRPDLFLHFFVHIPWPQPDSWRVLPPEWREAIFRGLLGSDIVAFHTERYVRNFLIGCRELLGLDVDDERSVVHLPGREVRVRHYPISVDPSSLAELANTPEAEHHEGELAALRREHLVLRVDRTDPSKNIVRGFLAFDRLLEMHPELTGRVTFLALLQPSRQDVREYVEYIEEIQRVVAWINGKHRTADWMPIDLRLGDDIALTVAAYRCFDVLMVNAVFDGMNLVAKEALLVNERAGVLALSENTGAHDELGAVAVTLHPFDVEQQAQALYEALMMPAAQRQARHEVGVEIVRTNNVHKWLQHQLHDIDLSLAGAE
jgi:trehalose 6-phosphate synthase